jgi:apolipoprotein N-acyltransferase
LRGNPYALAVASGILLALSFPPSPLGFLAFVAFLPLLVSVRGRPVGIVFRSSMLAGSTFGVCLLYWIANLWVEPKVKPFLVGGVGLLCIYFGLAFAFPLTGLRLATKRFGRLGLLSFPFFFVGLEFLRSLSHMGFPWGSIGYTQTEYPQLIQFASVTSVAGVSFWVASINLSLYFLFFGGLKRNLKLLSVVVLLVLFGLPLMQWHFMPKDCGGGQVRVAVVQAGVPPSLKRSGEDEERLAILIEESHRIARGEVELAVWPETAVPGYFPRESGYESVVQAVSDSLATPILLGSQDLKRAGEKRYDYYNAAFLISPHEGICGTYHKTQLVPFGERMPFDDVIPALRNIPLGQGHFSPGREHTIFKIGDKRFATLICFESIFPRLVRRFVNKDAQFLVNITEDGWYGRTSGQYQHAGMAVMRCIENRISLARCANTGISMFVDPYGRTSGRTRTFTRVTESAAISLRSCETFYSKHGDLFAWVLVTVSAVVLALIFLAGRGLCPGCARLRRDSY